MIEEVKEALEEFANTKVGKLEKQLTARMDGLQKHLKAVEAAANGARPYVSDVSGVSGATDEDRIMAQAIPAEYRHLVDRSDACNR